MVNTKGERKMDLNKMVMNSLENMQSGGKVQEIVDKHVAKTIESIVDDAFGSWSDFSKNLKKQVEEKLQVNFKKLDLASYNQVVLNIIKGELERSIHEEGAKRIQKSIQEILGTSKEEYKLSELIKEIVEQDCELDELDYDDRKEITVIVEDKYGLKHIYIDTEEDVKWYQCKYEIVLDKDLTVSRAEIGDKSFDNKVIMGGLYGADATIFKMWTRKSKLVIDSYDTSFTNPEYD